MNFEYKICRLNSNFYKVYKPNLYHEILSKPERPYFCLLIDIHDDYYICVPYRTSISHNNAFLFKNSARSKNSRSGLDFTKIAIIKDTSYLDAEKITIDEDEYKETINNLEQIAANALEYVNTYINHVNGSNKIHPREFARRYQYSTLQYYHDILGLNTVLLS